MGRLWFLGIAVPALLSQQPRQRPEPLMFPLGVEKCAAVQQFDTGQTSEGMVCVKLVQKPNDQYHQFSVEVLSTTPLADRALVTVMFESGNEIKKKQSLTLESPTIVSGIPAVAEFSGVPVMGVLGIKVALVKVETVASKEFFR